MPRISLSQFTEWERGIGYVAGMAPALHWMLAQLLDMKQDEKHRLGFMTAYAMLGMQTIENGLKSLVAADGDWLRNTHDLVTIHGKIANKQWQVYLDAAWVATEKYRSFRSFMYENRNRMQELRFGFIDNKSAPSRGFAPAIPYAVDAVLSASYQALRDVLEQDISDANLDSCDHCSQRAHSICMNCRQAVWGKTISSDLYHGFQEYLAQHPDIDWR